MNVDRIHVSMDFSQPAGNALLVAHAWARKLEAALRVIHVQHPVPESAVAVHRAPSVEQLSALLDEEVLAAIGPTGLDELSTEALCHKSPPIAICADARAHEADLIVVGTHGRTGLAHLMIGSVAERIVRHADRPVLVVRGDASAASAPAHILVCTDFSPDAEPAFSPAAELGAAFEARITVLHVHPEADRRAALGEGGPEAAAALEQTLLDSLDSVRATHLPSSAAVALLFDDHPAEAIVRYAADHGASLVVVATHGRTGVSHLLIGSVAERVVRRAPCSVLIVRASNGA